MFDEKKKPAIEIEDTLDEKEDVIKIYRELSELIFIAFEKEINTTEGMKKLYAAITTIMIVFSRTLGYTKEQTLEYIRQILDSDKNTPSQKEEKIFN